jgi:hypothetical protein
MRRDHDRGVERSTLLAITAMVLFSGAVGPVQVPVQAQPPNPANPITLRPGTIIDPARGVAYVMSEKGGIARIDLANGQEVWHSTVAARPLGLGPAGQRLIGQAEAAPTPNHLSVVALNAGNGNAITKSDGARLAAAHPLPPSVRPAVTSTVHGEFNAAARFTDDHAVVTWHYVPRPRRGLPPGVEQKLQPRRPGAGAGKAAKAASPPANLQGGGFQLNLTSGDVSPMAASAPGAPGAPGPGEPAAASWRPVEVPEAERVPQVPGHQFYTEDKRFIMSHGETPPDENGQYTLVVYDGATKKSVGEFKSFHAVLPCYVADAHAIFQTSGAKLRSGGSLSEQPPMLAAVDLKTGQQLWSYPLRDTTYRGPYPP